MGTNRNEEDVTLEVMKQVAEIIRRVGKRSEIEDEVAGNINFSQLVAELLMQDGPVRDAGVKLVTAFLKGYEIEPESREAEQILENIDYKKLVGGMTKD